MLRELSQRSVFALELRPGFKDPRSAECLAGRPSRQYRADTDLVLGAKDDDLDQGGDAERIDVGQAGQAEDQPLAGKNHVGGEQLQHFLFLGLVIPEPEITGNTENSAMAMTLKASLHSSTIPQMAGLQ